MPKLGIAVDEQAYHLLKKHGGHRHIGALVGRLIRQFDCDENLGLSDIHDRLDHLIELLEKRQEVRKEK